MKSPVMFQTYCYRNLEDLDHLAEIWNNLSSRGPGVRTFQSLDWYRFCLNRFNQPATPYILLVYVLDRPVGILPLAQYQFTSSCGIINTLGYLPVNCGVPFGVIGPNQAATLAGGIKFIQQAGFSDDLLELPHVEKWYLDQGRTENAFRMADCKPHEIPELLTSSMHDFNRLPLNHYTQTPGHHRMQRTASSITTFRSTIDPVGKLLHILEQLEGYQLVTGDPQVWNQLSEILMLIDQAQALELTIQFHHNRGLTLIVSSFDHNKDKRSFQMFHALHETDLTASQSELVSIFQDPLDRDELYQHLLNSCREYGDEKLIWSPCLTTFFRSKIHQEQLVPQVCYRQYKWSSARSIKLRFSQILRGNNHHGRINNINSQSAKPFLIHHEFKSYAAIAKLNQSKKSPVEIQHNPQNTLASDTCRQDHAAHQNIGSNIPFSLKLYRE